MMTDRQAEMLNDTGWGVGPDKDAELVATVMRGDTTAFNDLVRRHGRLVYRVTIAITGKKRMPRKHYRTRS